MSREFTEEEKRESFIGFLEESGVPPSPEFRSGEEQDFGLVDPNKPQVEVKRNILDEKFTPEEQERGFLDLMKELTVPGDPTKTGEFSDPTAGFQGLKTAQTQREAAEKLASEEGVDIESGGPVDARLKLSLGLSDESRDAILRNNFPDGVRTTKAGPVVTIKDKDGNKREVLLDETGLSLKDFADAGGPLLEVLGAIGGVTAVIAAAPAIVTSALAVPILAVVGGVAGQVPVTIAEIIASMKSGGIDLDAPEDVELLESIIKSRGIRATTDVVLDMVTAGTARSVKGTTQKAIAPFAKRISESPQREVIAAAEALDVRLSPGKTIGSPTLQRAEAMAERLPGSAPVVEKALKREASDLRRAQRSILPRAQQDVPLAENIGKSLNKKLKQRTLNTQLIAESQDRARLITSENAIDELNEEAVKRIDKRFFELQRKISNRNLSVEDSGEFVRTSILKKKNDLTKNQKFIETNLSEAVKQLPKEQHAWVSTKALKREAKRLLKEIPPKIKQVKTKTGKIVEKEVPNLDFIGTESTIYKTINDLPEKITFTQARNLRNGLFNRLGNLDLFPGMDKGRIKKIAGVSVKMIRHSFKDAPTKEIGVLARRSQDHWSKNIVPFEIGIIQKGIREEIEGSFVVQSENLLPFLLMNGRRGDATKVISVLGKDSSAVKAARRSVLNELIDKHRLSSFEGNVINAKSLQKEMRRLDLKGTSKIILGEQDTEFNRLLKFAAGRQGVLRLPKLQNLPPDANIRDILIESVKREAEFQKDVRVKMANAALKRSFPDIRSDEKFVYNMMREPLDRIERVWKFATEKEKQDFRERLMVNMLEISSSSKELADKVASIGGKEAALGTTMTDVMSSFASNDTAQSLKKLEFVLGDRLKVLKNLAIVQAAEKQGRDAASAVGGISAGMTISNIITTPFVKTGDQVKTPLTKIAKWWVAAKLLNNDVTRKWLLNKTLLKNPTARSRTLQAIIPQFGRLATQEFGENSETAQEINAFLNSPQFENAFTPK